VNTGMCTPEGCQYCIGAYCLRYQVALETEARKVLMFTALCGLGGHME
jgi:hypothetical protein